MVFSPVQTEGDTDNSFWAISGLTTVTPTRKNSPLPSINFNVWMMELPKSVSAADIVNPAFRRRELKTPS